MNFVGFDSHDHSRCISRGVDIADQACKKQGLQLTRIRRRVLEMLLAQHCALGAYDILERLRQEGFSAQPPTAYRALDFLVSHGFAHKIENLNAFISCTNPGASHMPVFLICNKCRSVAESCADSARGLLGKLAEQSGFQVQQTVVEATGLCPNCQEQP